MTITTRKRQTNSNQYNLTIPGVISGGGAIEKSNNNGVLALTGSNTYSGGTFIASDVSGYNTSNTVQINTDASLGTAPEFACDEHHHYRRLHGSAAIRQRLHAV